MPLGEIHAICRATANGQLNNAGPECADKAVLAGYWHGKYENSEAKFRRAEFGAYWRQESMLAQNFPGLIDQIITARQEARQAGNFDLADSLRGILEGAGIATLDAKRTTTWSWRHGWLKGRVEFCQGESEEILIMPDGSAP